MKSKKISNEYNPFFSISYINRRIDELAETCNAVDFESKKMHIIEALNSIEKK